MSEQRGAYAVGSLPVIGATSDECDKAYWAREGLIKRQQEEIQRLRAAIEGAYNIACETFESVNQMELIRLTLVEGLNSKEDAK